MILPGFDTCNFVVYTFKRSILPRNEFNVSYLDRIIQKLNTFYEKLMLPKIVSSVPN